MVNYSVSFISMKNKVLNVYKPVGWTPLDVVKKLKELDEFSESKMSYAGKLDPMAEGVLLILIDEKTQEQEKYQSMNKEYVSEIVFGFSTDSYDSLGLVNSSKDDFFLSKEVVLDILKDYNGDLDIELPPFSSFKIEGKPLFWWAREGKLSEIEIPTKKMTVFQNSLSKYDSIGKGKLKSELTKRIKSVDGDFRQDLIEDKWISSLDKSELSKFPMARIKFQCSSGTYIRSLVNDISKTLEVPAFLYSLVRTKVGLPEKDNQVFWVGDTIRVENL